MCQGKLSSSFPLYDEDRKFECNWQLSFLVVVAFVLNIPECKSGNLYYVHVRRKSLA